MAPPLFILKDVHLTFGGTPLLEGAELTVSAGQKLALVGRNGSGKSTFLKIAAAIIEPDRGDRALQQGVTLRYLPQEPDLRGFATTGDYVVAGLTSGDDPHRASYLLQQLGLTGLEEPARLSGGEARRAALARAMAPEPDILLLDEPTNHLDLPAIEWLEGELKRSRSALVLISHDRRFLETLSDSVLWLDRGRTRLLAKGFAAFEAWRDDILELEEKERHRLDRKIAQEQDWLRYGVTARRKRNMGRLRALQGLRKERREQRRVLGQVEMTAAEGPSSGKLVIEAKGVAKSYDDRPIVQPLSLRLKKGDRLGVVGPNGAGKTTLLNLLTGALAPDAGTVRLGANVVMVTLDQKREALDPETSLQDTLTGGRGDHVFVGGQPRHVMGYMKDFLFSAEQARTPVRVLSGGERGRLMLARALAAPSNLLVLDEPTNDLDLETLDLLEELLADYEGTVLVVSHDRDFLDRVATSVLAFEGAGNWTEYAGGYSDMITQRGHGVLAREPLEARRPDKGQAAAREAAAPRRRLGFKEQHALKTLPEEIERRRREIAALEAKLADPALFAADPALFARTTEALTATHDALAEAEDRWLELEMLREELEGQA
ncbi:ATP-binding cassette, subfamily F, uup [Arboricoccus pini]|uniref:ATP-binding protein Uup n=1 Tax=Arboricoccus pini TaxID=1963835 RepID=A0A212RSZ2_9PROT|nr:ABC-F family ATP-binding cassette domain-containing protein [Arboricoccus pini]SNB75787.1 ATP-binding cassette, subfamily F, uup [Arboricoccus pini]